MNLKRIFLIFSAYVFSLVVGAVHPAYAQDMLDVDVKALPEIIMMSQDEFDDQTLDLSKSFEEQPGLDYLFRLPEGWSNTKGVGDVPDVMLSDKIPTAIAHYIGPARLTGSRSEVLIDALALTYQVSAQQWMQDYLSNNSYTIEAMNVASNQEAEALFVVVRQDVSYIVRAKVVVNGARMFFAQYYLPIANWDDKKAEQAQVIASFQAKNRIDDFITKTKTFSFLDVDTVIYPETWSVRAPTFKNMDRMSASFLNAVAAPVNGDDQPARVLDGKVDINLFSVFVVEDLEMEIKKFKTDVAQDGWVLGESIDVDRDVFFNDDFEFAKTEAYQVSDELAQLLDYEIWISYMSAGDYYYFTKLLTPARESDSFVWERNLEAYVDILEALDPNIKQ